MESKIFRLVISMFFLLIFIILIGCGRISEKSGIDNEQATEISNCREQQTNYSGLEGKELEDLNKLRSGVPEEY